MFHFSFFRRFLRLQAFSLLFFQIYSFAQEKFEPTIVKVRADMWCPYNCKPGSLNPGFMIEVLEEAFGKNNVNYELLPWTRAIIETRRGKADAIVGAADTDAPDFLQSYSFAKTSTCFYKFSKDPWVYTNTTSIQGKKLGFVGGYTYADFVMAYISDSKNKSLIFSKFQEDRALLSLLEMVADGTIQIVVDDESVMNHILDKNPHLKLKVTNAGCANGPEGSFPVGVSFSPKTQSRSRILVKQLNLTIESMIKNGKMEELVKKYKIKRW